MFIQYVSHELRNPLNAIFIGADLMYKDINNGIDQQTIIQILDDILLSCRKSMEVLDELLSVETMNSGVTLLARTLIPINALITDAMLPFRHQVLD